MTHHVCPDLISSHSHWCSPRKSLVSPIVTQKSSFGAVFLQSINCPHCNLLPPASATLNSCHLLTRSSANYADFSLFNTFHLITSGPLQSVRSRLLLALLVNHHPQPCFALQHPTSLYSILDYHFFNLQFLCQGLELEE